jgi:glycine/D-amino acid oxidase-like deaminating enzyme
VKGQAATFYFDEPLPFNYSISSLGFLAYLKSTPRKLVVGSTYEHHFNHIGPDQKGLELLTRKLDNLYPDLTDQIQKSEMWSAVRVTTKDRKPVAGPHPEKRGLYIISALGSKGLMHGPLTAYYLANYIADGKSIPEEISINRFRHI